MPAVEIVLGQSPARVRGTIRDRDGQGVPSGVIVFVPESQSYWNYRVANADANGRFELEAAPGRYRTFAWTEIEGAAYLDADVMEKYAGRGLPLDLKESVAMDWNVQVLD
jgi:hypothetical protein